MSTIVLNTLNYVGEGIVNGISRFTEKSAGVVAGFRRLTASIGFTSAKTTVKWKLVIPIVQTEADACACPGAVLQETYVDITVRYDIKATQTQRDDTLAEIRDLVQTTQFGDSVAGLVLPS